MSDIERRGFVATALAAGLTPLAAAQTGPPAAEESRNLRLVADFCAAWATRDFQRILPYLADDSVYRMSEEMPPVVGHAGVRERLGSWLETSQQIEFRIVDAYAKGPLVINHRVDRFISTTRPLTWEGVGVFFLKNGKIKEWSDYTIKVDRG